MWVALVLFARERLAGHGRDIAQAPGCCDECTFLGWYQHREAVKVCRGLVLLDCCIVEHEGAPLTY